MYKVKLHENHTANDSQITPDGYLSLFESDAPMLYEEHYAKLMARRFGGKIEQDDLSDAMNNFKVLTIDTAQLSGQLRKFITNTFRKNEFIDSELALNILQTVIPTMEDKILKINLQAVCQYIIGCNKIYLI